MPAQTAVSGLMGKLGNRLVTAANKHAKDEADYGNMELPGGIDNGIAQLYDVKFGQYKEGTDLAGEYFFLASGVVKAPVEFNGMKVEGLHTRIGPEPMCDTPRAGGKRKTLEDHLAWVQNMMRILLLPAGATPQQKEQVARMLSGDQLEKTALLLKTKKPHFRFRTWKPDKTVIGENPDTGRFQLYAEDDNGNRKLQRADQSWDTLEDAQRANPWAGNEPRVQHMWAGLVDFKAPAPSAAVNDNSAVARNGTTAPAQTQVAAASPSKPAPSKPAPAAPKPSTPAKPSAPSKPAPAPTPANEAEPEAFDETNDLGGLVAKADDDDPAVHLPARKELKEGALRAGYGEEEIEAVAGWADVAAMIGSPKQEAPELVVDDGADEPAAGDDGEPAGEAEPEAAPEPEPEGYTPRKDDVVFYRPKVKKDGKLVPAAKAVEHEVLSVDLKKKTVTLKNLDTGKVLAGADGKPFPLPWDKLEAEPA